MARRGAVDRGVRERSKASGKWWAEYAGADGKMHLEFGGSKSAARKLYELRKTEVREGRWFPAARRRSALFDDLLKDYQKSKAAEVKAVQRGDYGYTHHLKNSAASARMRSRLATWRRSATDWEQV